MSSGRARRRPVGLPGVGNDPMQRAIGVDAIDRLHRLLDRLMTQVTRIAEVDSAFLVDAEIVGRVVGVAFVCVGEHGDAAIALGSGDATAARLAHHEASLLIEEQPIGAARLLAKDFHLAQDFLAHLTSAVQFGFITGTLVFAVFTISDRFSPSRVFFISSIVRFKRILLSIFLNSADVSGK